jgi:hypothetical protein
MRTSEDDDVSIPPVIQKPTSQQSNDE